MDVAVLGSWSTSDCGAAVAGDDVVDVSGTTSPHPVEDFEIFLDAFGEGCFFPVVCAVSGFAPMNKWDAQLLGALLALVDLTSSVEEEGLDVVPAAAASLGDDDAFATGDAGISLHSVWTTGEAEDVDVVVLPAGGEDDDVIMGDDDVVVCPAGGADEATTSSSGEGSVGGRRVVGCGDGGSGGDVIDVARVVLTSVLWTIIVDSRVSK